MTLYRLKELAREFRRNPDYRERFYIADEMSQLVDSLPLALERGENPMTVTEVSDRYKILDDWLRGHDAWALWEVTLGSPRMKVEGYAVRETSFVIVRHLHRGDWDVYVPCHATLDRSSLKRLDDYVRGDG